MKCNSIYRSCTLTVCYNKITIGINKLQKLKILNIFLERTIKKVEDNIKQNYDSKKKHQSNKYILQ